MVDSKQLKAVVALLAFLWPHGAASAQPLPGSVELTTEGDHSRHQSYGQRRGSERFPSRREAI